MFLCDGFGGSGTPEFDPPGAYAATMPTPEPPGDQPPGWWGPPTGAPLAWAPPTPSPRARPRRGWATGAIVSVTMVGLIALTAWLQRPPPAPPASPGTTLLAPDGHVETLAAPGLQVWIETAQTSTASLLGSGPPAFALSDPDGPTDMLAEHHHRATSTWVRPGSVTQTEEFYRVSADGVALTTSSQVGGEYAVYQPGLMLLPADIAAGRTWHGAGVMLTGAASDFHDVTQHTYSFTARAQAPADDSGFGRGCMAIEMTLTRDNEPSTSTRTWCSGRGLVADTSHDISATASSADALAPLDLASAPGWRPDTWRHPRTEHRTLPPPVSWNLATAPTDLDGGFIVTDQNSGDVVATDATLAKVRWRTHPGGTITHATTAGELFVVATSQRRLVAYDRHGVRRWTRELPDLVAHPPQRHGDTLVVADVGGRVHGIDLRLGHIAWTFHVPHRIVEAPHVGDVIVVPHAAPGIQVLDHSGAPLWSADLADPPDMALASGRSVVVGDGPVLRQYSEAGKPTAVLSTRDGQAVQAITIAGGDTVVVRYRGAISGYTTEPTLRQSWRVPIEATQLIAVGTTIVAATSGEIVVLAHTGEVLHRWRGHFATSNMVFLSPRDDGCVLVDRRFTVTEVGP